MSRTYLLSAIVLAACGAHSASNAKPVQEPRLSTYSPELEPFRCELLGATPENRDELENASFAKALGFAADLSYLRVTRFASAQHHYDIAELGEPCLTATDRTACEAKLIALEKEGHSRPQVFAIINRGDDLELIEGEEILARFDTINTPERAWLVLMIRQEFGGVLCGDAYVSGQRETTDGFELGQLRTTSRCRPFQRVRSIYRVSRSGAVAFVSEPVIEHDADRCIVNEAGVRGGSAQ